MADQSLYRVQIDIDANGNSAVRGVRKVTAASKESGAAGKQAGHDHKSGMEEATIATGKFRGAVGELAGVAGLAGLGFGIDEIVKKGQDWQLQQSRLAQAAKSAGLEVGTTLETLNKSADETSQAGGFDAPAQAGALAQFLRLTGSTTKAIQANAAAMEFARGSGLGYQQAQLLVGQALTGNVGRLQRYIGTIQPVKTAEYALSQAHKINLDALEAQAKTLGKAGPAWLKQQELLAGLTPKQVQHAQLLDKQATAQKALTAIQDKYGGSLDKFSKTTAGAISNAKNVLDLALEKLGAEALPIVAKIATTVANAVKYLSEHKDVFKFIGIAFGVFLGSLVFTKAIEGIQAMTAAVVAFSGAEEGATFLAVAWGTALRLTIIGLVITALYLLITHWKQVRTVAVEVWDRIKTAAKDAANFIKGIWDGVLNGIIGGFNKVIDAINKIINAYNSVVGSVPGLGGLKIGTIGHIGGVGQQNQPKVPAPKGWVPVPGSPGLYAPPKSKSVPAPKGWVPVPGSPGIYEPKSTQSATIVLHHTTNLNGRAIAEETAHFVRKVNALAGAPAAALSSF